MVYTPYTQGRVDEDWEILLNLYAVAYDSINSSMLVGDEEEVRVDKTTREEVAKYFAILRNVAKKYSPNLVDEVDEMRILTFKLMDGKISRRKFLEKVRKIVLRNGLSPQLLEAVERRIDMMEQSKPRLIQPTPIKPFDFKIKPLKLNPILPAKPPKLNFKIKPFGLPLKPSNLQIQPLMLRNRKRKQGTFMDLMKNFMRGGK